MSSLMVVLITQKWILLGILSELKRFFNNDSGSGKGVYLLCNGGSRNWSCPRQTIAQRLLNSISLGVAWAV